MDITEVDVQAHFFIAGVYLKQVRIPAGHHVMTHKHQYDHASILAQGCAIVTCDGVQTTHYSPDVIEIKKGIAHEVVAVNGDVLWYCVHSLYNVDQSLWTPDMIDNVLVESNE